MPAATCLPTPDIQILATEPITGKVYYINERFQKEEIFYYEVRLFVVSWCHMRAYVRGHWYGRKVRSPIKLCAHVVLRCVVAPDTSFMEDNNARASFRVSTQKEVSRVRMHAP